MATFDGLIAICAKILCRNTYNHMTILWVFAVLTSKMDVKTHINHEIKCHLSLLKLLSWQGLPYCDANKLFHIFLNTICIVAHLSVMVNLLKYVSVRCCKVYTVTTLKFCIYCYFP